MEDPAARGPHLNSVLARLSARLVDPELWPAGVEPRPQLGECQPADQVSDAYKQEKAERHQDIAFTAG